ncbi:MAG: DNA polymerase III subunit epsilon [Buchnera aphidicola (Nurudea yanoniella)]
MKHKKLEKRTIVLDTETTGMNRIGCFYKTHRIIEIGAVEIVDNCIIEKNFHSYICPDRLIDRDAFKIHGISNNFLLDKPKFFEIAPDFLKYVKDSELIIHNSKFDISFINYELSMLNLNTKNILDICNVIDTLEIARKIFPGKKNTLDALCLRYKIHTNNRNIHSAIYDAKLLAKVYIFMKNRQESLPFLSTNHHLYHKKRKCNVLKKFKLKSKFAKNCDIILHEKYLQKMIKKTGKCIWMNKK